MSNEVKIVRPNFDVKFSFEKKSDDEGMVFSGYGAAFDNIDSYGDKIIKGAFKKSIKSFKNKEHPIAMLKQHGWPSPDPIGVWQEMKEDDYGLHVTGKISGTQDGKDIYTLLSDGAISGLSIGYIPKKVSRETVKGKEVFVLEEIELHEISVVTFPANTLARVDNVKSNMEKKRILESILRDAGMFSKKEAMTIVSKCDELWCCDGTKEIKECLQMAEVFNLIQDHTNFLNKV